MKKKGMCVFLATAMMYVGGCSAAKVASSAGGFIAGGAETEAVTTSAAPERRVDIATIIYVDDINNEIEETSTAAAAVTTISAESTAESQSQTSGAITETSYISSPETSTEASVTEAPVSASPITEQQYVETFMSEAETVTKIHETTPSETTDPVEHKAFPDFNAYFRNSFTVADSVRIRPTNKITYHIDLQNTSIVKDYADLIDSETEYALIGESVDDGTFRTERYYFDYTGPGKSDLSAWSTDGYMAKASIYVFYSSISSGWMEVTVEYVDGVDYKDTGYRSSIVL